SSRDYSGGGLVALDTLNLDNSILISNTATTVGGGLSASITARIVNSLFVHNWAPSNGAAMALKTGSILHSTIADTTLNPSSAIVIYTGTIGITDTIIASHTIGISAIANTGYENYNLFFGNTQNLSGTLTSGGNSLTGNPNFVSPASNDYHLGF